jgi:hypothetical protein
MSAIAAQNASALAQPSRSESQSRTLLIRFALAALAVAFSYLFRWQLLRFLTSEANLRLDLLAGIHLQRISADTVMWKGVLYRYVNACTFVDVWFGSVPLLWSLRRSLARNMLMMGGFALAMFCFNVFRLSLSDVLFAAGVPWDLAHNVISGISYFVVWVWIWNRMAKRRPNMKLCSSQSWN